MTLELEGSVEYKMITRTISAIVGIIIAIAVLFLSNTIVFNIAIAGITVVILIELFKACDCLKNKSQITIALIFAIGMPFLMLTDEMIYRYLLGTGCVFAMFFAYIISHKKIDFFRLCFIISTTILVSLSLGCLITLRDISDVHGVCYIILALAGAWLGDSGAYFVGTLFGKHKLCPDISPKKTIEGAVGGVVSTGVIFAIYGLCYTLFQHSRGIDFQTNYVLLVILGMLCALIGMIGDLTASLIKRQNNVKDFGHIMPGHGGLMDRFDSVLFVTPFMAMVLTYIKIFN